MSTGEAAHLLGVSSQRVRMLWRDGQLFGRMVANRLLLDRSSVLELAERQRPATRPLSARNAWSLLFLLTAETNPQASPSDMSRLRRLLFTRDARTISALVRGRSRTARFAGVAEAGRYLLGSDGVVPAGVTAAHRLTDLVADDVTEIYTSEARAQELATRLRLWPDPQGRVIVHAVPAGQAILLEGRAEMPVSAVAVDLLESSDPRTHRAGEVLWANVLQQWREEAPPLRERLGRRNARRAASSE